MKYILTITYVIVCFFVIGQNDTLNQKDINGLKQGNWIYYGKDLPESYSPSDGKAEEGAYFDGKKTGIWIKYHFDGETVKMKGEYKNNRPVGAFLRFNRDGSFLDSVNIQGVNSYTKGRGGNNVTFSNNGYSDSVQQISTTFETGSCNCINDKYLKTYDIEGNILFEGLCKNDEFWDCKMHYYDSDGILLRIEIWKEGQFHSLGKL